MTLGEQLKKKRMECGYSIEQIAEMTRISIPTLNGIESGDPSVMPAKPFARGFIRTYAKMVGLDPNAAVNLFDQESSETEDFPEPSNPPPNLLVQPPAEDKESVLWFQASRTFFMLIGLIITAALCAVIFFALEKFSSYDQEKMTVEENVQEKTSTPDDSLYVTPSLPQDTEIAPETTVPAKEENSENKEPEAMPLAPQKKKNVPKVKKSDRAPKATTQTPTEGSTEPHKISIHAFQNVDLTIVWAVGTPQTFQLKPNEIKNILFSKPVKLRINNGSAVKITFDSKPVAISTLQEPIELSYP